VKLLPIALFALFLSIPLSPHICSHAADPPAPDTTPGHREPGREKSTACIRFNNLNSLIRDNRIGREPARAELKRLLAEIREEYYRAGGIDYPKTAWVFPLAGYTVGAIEGGRRHGFIPSGYDYFTGNRHGGHPAFDIFIHDRGQKGLDTRTGAPVKVLSLTGGVVVALEREWEQGSRLRGGKYLWIYDPANDLLVYYAHNGGLQVGLGDVVKPGDVVATVGRSGYNAAKRRSPTHLHLSVLKVTDGRPLPVNTYADLKRAKTMAAE
jgi:murein DD-endopeptidase MepM/ murein hydrolase activator NlpD